MSLHNVGTSDFNPSDLERLFILDEMIRHGTIFATIHSQFRIMRQLQSMIVLVDGGEQFPCFHRHGLRGGE